MGKSNDSESGSLSSYIINEENSSRKVFFNIALPSTALDKYGVPLYQYKKNKLRTSKYTILTFIPGNLYEQFHRIANLFFLSMVIMQAFPVFGVVNPVFSAMPLTCVMCVTALKDGYEDLKRHREDNRVNNTEAYILNDWVNTNYPSYHISFYRKIKSKILKVFHWIARVLHLKSKSSKKIFKKNKNSDITLKQSYEAKPLKNQTTNDTIGENQSNESMSLIKEENPIDFSIKPNKDTGWKEVHWKDIRVGDIILLSTNENVPADIVVLSTSEEENECYVETKNLDGETTLKRRSGRRETQGIRDEKSAKNSKFIITAENPVVNLYEFKSRIELPVQDKTNKLDNQEKKSSEMNMKYNCSSNEDEAIFPNGKISIPLDITNLILRGSVIRNTEWVIGAVIYTGEDTKVCLNSGVTPSKRSRIEKLMNPQVVFNFLILFFTAITVSIINVRILSEWDKNKPPFHNFRNRAITRKFLETFGSTMIMMQNVVPISLYISIEIAKTIQAWFIHEDIDLYYEEDDNPCNTKTWNISDDLGQIEYIFSDKTGTLTQNKMDFMRCSIIGKTYEEEMENRMKAALFEYYDNPFIDKSTRFSFLDEQLLSDLSNENSLQGKGVFFFFRHLALCHSVLSPKPVVLEDGTETQYINYCAESPDEQALVTTAKNLGFVFVRRTESTITINCFGKEETYEVLHILEFDSVRKRMSVILRTPKNEILLLCKGADTVIYERLQKNQENLRNVTFSHLEKFGSEGLRTLCIAYRYINAKEYQKWSEDYHKAEISLEDRDKLKDDLASAIERNLVLLGATAIEDKLQEGVPECISTLQDAGIKVWVLTGDKLETAINIGFASNLLNRSMCLLAIRERSKASLGMNEYDNINDVQTQLKNAYSIIDKYGNPKNHHRKSGRNSVWVVANLIMTIIEKVQQKILAKQDDYDLKSNDSERFQFFSKNKRYSNISTFSVSSGKSFANVLMGQQEPSKDIDFALIVDGQSLHIILENPNLRRRFLETAINCKAVICCRVSPKQKSEVVGLVKNGLHVLCLSIGDGANDISMIQEANIGVGIAGQEGMQAAMSSDYAISQFRFLSKLLLIHGRWSYYRVSNMVLNFFYKNIVWVFTLFWYQFNCGFSAQILFDYTFLMFFNFLFSSLPVMVMGIFDKDLKHGTLLNKPALYETMGISQRRFTWKRFISFIADAIYQSYICFFLPYCSFINSGFKNGLDPDLYYFGCIISCYVITLVNIFVALNMKSINWISGVVLVIEIVSFLLYFMVYAHLPFFKFYNEYFKFMFTDIKFWCLYILVIVVALYPRIFFKYIKTTFYPGDSDIYREIEKYHLSVDDEGYDDDLCNYCDELEQKATVSPGKDYIIGTSLTSLQEEDQPPSYNHTIGSVVEVTQNLNKNSTFNSAIDYSSSYKSEGNEVSLNANIKSNTISVGVFPSFSIKKSNKDKLNDVVVNTSNQNITNLDQILQAEDGGEIIGGASNGYEVSTILGGSQQMYQSATSVFTSLSGIKEDDHSYNNINSNNLLTPINNTNARSSTIRSTYGKVDPRHKAMSIRSAKSRRYNILRQGTSVDGQAMSVIFMDNNEEYVNTGFAFSYNDENEVRGRNRKANPLLKAKSVDEIYDDKKDKNLKLKNKTSSFVVRRQSQPEPAYIKKNINKK
ncbi:phospholipid-translocating P-type ATPase [Neocallimastix californiae]|uniref:Phospholipid-transporting ATPase n=1 Tax=Neocallimastix californiae TaxID=1754190 RepID=A0A1Y2DBV3_9FUNG|nr:phospholipid-translocating P-type ATPase [Neocallimastix californiae]|eukprot:ORY56739.1 phospholipid-translocating P-type ATPase [Neocallimastix californiae]